MSDELPSAPSSAALHPDLFGVRRDAQGYSVVLNAAPGCKAVVCLDALPGRRAAQQAARVLGALSEGLTLGAFAGSAQVRQTLWALRAAHEPAQTLKTLRGALLDSREGQEEERRRAREAVRNEMRGEVLCPVRFGAYNRARSEALRLGRPGHRATLAASCRFVEAHLRGLGAAFPPCAQQFGVRAGAVIEARLREGA